MLIFRWYRARIIDFDDSLELHTDHLGKDAKVFFVDYGRSYDVAIADIRTIQPDHLTLPFQAIECSLANVGKYKGANGQRKWSEAAQVLLEMTKEKELRANVRSNEAFRLDLDLFFKTGDKWENVNEKLIGLELASHSPNLIAPGKLMIIPG